jgi:sarcosine oxidase subunit beta
MAQNHPDRGQRGLPGGAPRYSAFALAKKAMNYHQDWQRAWRDPEPKAEYDAVIIGGGGHGLATAYYLAAVHGLTNIAVIEKGWIGGGNTGRNTTIIRSNYLWDESAAIYEHSMKLWEGMSQDLNFNVMFSQRGVLTIAHSEHELREMSRRVHAIRLNGIDSEILGPAEIKKFVPTINIDQSIRYPVMGGFLQRRGGTVRHDAVAWGYARAADQLGVDIIQNCEVTGFRIEGGTCLGVDTSRGYIAGGKIAACVAGSSGRLMSKAGMRLPIESHVLQAFVSEGLKPVLPGVITFGAGHFYCSQSDKGGLVFGGDIDGYNSYAQRGNLPVVEDVCEGAMAIFPMLGRVRLLRMWGGIMDMSMDGSPIIDRTHIDRLYFNGGWCYGGFKATPASGWCYAHLLATDAPHEFAKAYRFDRFEKGQMIDEKGVGNNPQLH